MTFRLQIASIVLMLAVVSSASAQDAKGWYEENCDGATFHFTKIPGRSNDQRLELFFRTGLIPFRLYPTGPEWRDVYGKRCPATGKCEDVVTAPNAKDAISRKWKSRSLREIRDRPQWRTPGGPVQGQRTISQAPFAHLHVNCWAAQTCQPMALWDNSEA
jgi:hypothetical protein